MDTDNVHLFTLFFAGPLAVAGFQVSRVPRGFRVPVHEKPDLYLQTITIAQCSDNISKKQFLGFIKGVARNSNLFLNFRYV